MRLQSGHEVTPVSKEDEERQKKCFKGYTESLVRFQPDGWYFFRPFALFADKYYNFPVRETDVFVMTNPKCGTTWMQEVVWTMVNNGNLDNPKGNMDSILRIPFMEFDSITESSNQRPFTESKDLMTYVEDQCPGKKIDKSNLFLTLAEGISDPRTIKTHLPLSLAPRDLLKTAKVVYVVRNAKDACLSYFHHNRLYKFSDFQGTLDEFVDFYVRGELMYSPFWTHIKEAWDQKDNPNLHICFFEHLKKDPVKEISRLNQFLQTNLSQEQVEKIADYTSFSNMKTRNDQGSPRDPYLYKNKHVIEEQGGFFRKGNTGNWKQGLTAEQNKKIDQWTKEKIDIFDDSFKDIYFSLSKPN